LLLLYPSVLLRREVFRPAALLCIDERRFLIDVKLKDSTAATADGFMALMKAYLADCRKHEHPATLIKIVMVQDIKDPTRFLLLEEFTSAAGPTARTQSAYHKALLPQLKPFLGGPATVSEFNTVG